MHLPRHLSWITSVTSQPLTSLPVFSISYSYWRVLRTVHVYLSPDLVLMCTVGGKGKVVEMNRGLGHLSSEVPWVSVTDSTQLDLSFLPVTGIKMNCSYFILDGVLLLLQNSGIDSIYFLGGSFPANPEITIITTKSLSQNLNLHLPLLLRSG